MKKTGHLKKMQVELAQPVNYHFVLDDELVAVNPLIGQHVTLTYAGVIHCTNCGRKTKKSFSQGYCFPCMKRLAQCDSCIVKPELCHFAQGTCREPQWGEDNCMQPHYVYLANSSGVKVGITRHNQIPTRWIDQGAVAALPLLQVSSRHLSGLVEVAFKEHVADKTHWQRMLKGAGEEVDLLVQRDVLLPLVREELDCLRERFGENAIRLLPEVETTHVEYPVHAYPQKVKALSFDKMPEISGVLQGIKGQYLLLDSGVLNIRKFTGYEVTLNA